MKKIILDLGHGGNDSGAIGKNGVKESDTVLKIGKEVNKLLNIDNVNLKVTRLEDKYISLAERVKIANEFNSDFFISLHMNSSSDRNVRGVEVWQFNDKNEELNKFSKNICLDISEELNIRNRGIKLSREFYVLKNTKMPACLIELDFISNMDAEKYIDNDENIRSIAKVIANNICKLVDVENKVEQLYKVCVGAYKSKSNALNQLELAKGKGFKDAYLI